MQKQAETFDLSFVSSFDLSLRIRVCVLDGQEERRRDSVVGRGSQRAYKSNCPRPREERRNFRCSPLFFSFGKGKWNSEAPLSESWRLLVNELSVDCGHESFAATRAAPVFMSGVTERNAFCWGEQRIETYRPFFFPRDNFRTPNNFQPLNNFPRRSKTLSPPSWI